MNENIKTVILKKIKEYDTIILCRHIRPDGDAVGSALAMKKVIEASFPCKRVFIDRKDESDQVAFLGSEGALPEEADLNGALVIVLDTGVPKRVSSDNFLKGKELVVIDHHIKEGEFGDFSWVEDHRNSVCEMITEFFFDFKDELVITKEAAESLYTGIVTDSGRFRFRGTSPKTLNLAAKLLELGVDYERIYAYIDVKDYVDVINDSRLVSHLKMTDSGVAYIIITNQIMSDYNLSQATAYNSTQIIENIKGSLIWLVLIENPDGTFRARIRSRFVEIEPIARNYSGGGHACAAGATIRSADEMERFIRDLDVCHSEFKKNNPQYF
ncbi:MAG: bifunctional oligoribonuclease/PAP phosphatase NrnA [Clostridia bacterium]|nr:bifunctional oligoribonuclease/PAP phosphatase NrnA [Clostridia bacterium]